MAGMMIAAERFDRIDAVRVTPISTSTTPRMRTSASGSLNSFLLRLPLKRVEKEVDERREEEGEEPEDLPSWSS